MSFGEAVKYASAMDLKVIPYENEKSMAATEKILAQLKNSRTAGIFIGPEGGFESAEVELAANNNIIPVSLGKRILRTETAGLALLSVMMMTIEMNINV
jgi:RNA methyltransferase, RsmE family